MGKLLGMLFGFLVANVPGAFLGFWVGRHFDAALAKQASGTRAGFENTQYFIKMTFQMMGYVAKATGRISEQDIQSARKLMAELRLNEAQRQEAMHDFNCGKNLDFPWLVHVRDFCAATPIDLRQQWLHLQMRLASDSGMTPSKHRCLMRIAAELGVPLPEMEAPAPKPAETLVEAYRTLGVTEAATDLAIKRAYRQLMQRNHPDRLVGSGASETVLEKAKEKTQKIQLAYEVIQKDRSRVSA